MAPGIFFAFLMFTNTLTTELTNPQPHLNHGVLSDEAWPVIPRGDDHQTYIRVNSENARVQGSVTYSSVLRPLNAIAIDRQITFHFDCTEDKARGWVTQLLMDAHVEVLEKEPPFNVTFWIEELLDGSAGGQ